MTFTKEKQILASHPQVPNQTLMNTGMTFLSMQEGVDTIWMSTTQNPTILGMPEI